MKQIIREVKVDKLKSEPQRREDTKLPKALVHLETVDTEDYYLGLITQEVSTDPDELVTLDEFKKMKEWK